MKNELARMPWKNGVYNLSRKFGFTLERYYNQYDKKYHYILFDKNGVIALVATSYIDMYHFLEGLDYVYWQNEKNKIEGDKNNGQAF